ncbi:hypothetical protein L1887_10662 [Cichorium endivia]|nr:hypothetical protein L1887_10662 [Cichorium endivia]
MKEHKLVLLDIKSNLSIPNSNSHSLPFEEVVSKPEATPVHQNPLWKQEKPVKILMRSIPLCCFFCKLQPALLLEPACETFPWLSPQIDNYLHSKSTFLSHFSSFQVKTLTVDHDSASHIYTQISYSLINIIITVFIIIIIVTPMARHASVTSSIGTSAPSTNDSSENDV